MPAKTESQELRHIIRTNNLNSISHVQIDIPVMETANENQAADSIDPPGEFRHTQIFPYISHPRESQASFSLSPDMDPLLHSYNATNEPIWDIRYLWHEISEGEEDENRNILKFWDALSDTYLKKRWFIEPGLPSTFMPDDVDYYIQLVSLPERVFESTSTRYLLCLFRVSDCTIVVQGMHVGGPEEVYDTIFNVIFNHARVEGKAIAYPPEAFSTLQWETAAEPIEQGGLNFELAPTDEHRWSVSEISKIPGEVLDAYIIHPETIDDLLPIKISGPAILRDTNYHCDFGKIYSTEQVEWAWATCDPVPDWDIDE